MTTAPDDLCAGEPIGEAAAEAHVGQRCRTPLTAGRVGVELEWLVRDRRDPSVPVTHDRVRAAVGSVVLRRGAISYEPGGQVEYSSHPADDLDGCVAATTRDMAMLREAGAAAGLDLVGAGMDPRRPPGEMLDLPRYVAMRQFFERAGRAGIWMMGCSASAQVCVDGDGAADRAGELARRWRSAHALGPLLVAMFANSPMVGSRVTGWASTRQAIWAKMDPSRTAPVLTSLDDSTDPAAAWARYCLDATVMCIRREPGRPWTIPPGLTFRDWIRRGGARPTLGDLDYHLSTLFPPVRPRGYLELRMIDAQPGDGWIVPLAVATTLLNDPVAGQQAREAAEALAWDGPGGSAPRGPALWLRAARLGLADPALAKAARTCTQAAIIALPPGAVRDAVEAFADRYVERGRCPGDDLLAQVS
jgi:glutamate--cysteine ligase